MLGRPVCWDRGRREANLWRTSPTSSGSSSKVGADEPFELKAPAPADWYGRRPVTVEKLVTVQAPGD